MGATERTLEEAHIKIVRLETELTNSRIALEKAERALVSRLDELNHSRRDHISKDAFEKFADHVNLRLSIQDEWRNRIAGGAATAEWVRMALFAMVALILAGLAYFK